MAVLNALDRLNLAKSAFKLTCVEILLGELCPASENLCNCHRKKELSICCELEGLSRCNTTEVRVSLVQVFLG